MAIPPAVGVERMGPLAARLLLPADCETGGLRGRAQPALGLILTALFERSLYLEAGGAFVCLGAPAIGNGPVNAVVSDTAWAALAAAARAGQQVGVRGGRLLAPGWQVDLAGAICWYPRPWPCALPAAVVRSGLASLRAVAAPYLPADGLAPLVLAGGALPATAGLGRLAAPRIAALREWLTHAALQPANGHGPPIDLLGLGPGLTPSGDDLLCGVLIALDALGARGLRHALAHAVLAAAPAVTTPLSRQFLAAAAEGLGAEALHDAIAALLSGDSGMSGGAGALSAAVAALGRIGHTSGWDALAGVVVAFEACS